MKRPARQATSLVFLTFIDLPAEKRGSCLRGEKPLTEKSPRLVGQIRGERMLAGGGCIVDDRTPAKPLWLEVMSFLDVFLRREDLCPELVVSSDEESAHRKTASRQVVQLRGANAGRRTLHSGRPNSGEAAAVGGDDLFGCYSPASVKSNRDTFSFMIYLAKGIGGIVWLITNIL